MHRIWSDSEKEFVKKNAALISDAEGARQLSAIVGRVVSVHAWRKQRQTMGLYKAPGRGVCRLAGESQAAPNAQESVVVVNTSPEPPADAHPIPAVNTDEVKLDF